MANTLAIVSLIIIIPAVVLFLAFSALTAYLVYLHWIYRHLPGPKRDSFFFGNIPLIMREKERGKTIHDIFIDQHRVYGPVILLWAYFTPFTCVSDPEMARKCLLTLNLPKHPRTYHHISFVFGHRMVGNGVLTEVNHEAWQKRRALLNPAFHRRYLMNLMSAFNSICDDFLAKIGEFADGKTAVNMAEEFNRVTLDVIGKVAFNVELGTIRDGNSPFPLAALKCLEGIQRHFERPFWRISVSMFPFQRSVIEAMKFIRSFGKKVIEERQEAMRKGEETPPDILAHILSVANKHSYLTTEDLVDDFVTFFIAGQETTSNQLAFTLYEVLKHPDVERRILREVDEVLGPRHYVTHMELGDLRYLGQTLKEGLRLHPPIGGFTRFTVKQENIGGYVLPARTPVNVSAFVVHRFPKAWQAPEEFDPDRFSPASNGGISHTAFLPFSLGPRSCIGQTFAQFEARVLMARLLQEFELKLLPGQDQLQHDSKLTLRPKGGVWCIIERRNNSIKVQDNKILQ